MTKQGGMTVSPWGWLMRKYTHLGKYFVGSLQQGDISWKLLLGSLRKSQESSAFL